MSASIKVYRQDRPKEWLKLNPYQKWRCDIFPADGSDHHGVGDTEAKAIFNASQAYMRWIGGFNEREPE